MTDEKPKFKAGDVVVRIVGPSQDETDCHMGEVATVEGWTPDYGGAGGAYVVTNLRTLRRYFDGTALWYTDNCELELVYDTPLYNALK
jgi:hypothetical protein